LGLMIGFDNWIIAVSSELHEVLHKEILISNVTWRYIRP